MEALFLRPLRKLRERQLNCPPFSFVIDALDECTSETQLAKLISLLGKALRESDLPKLHILLTSRSEAHVRAAMEEEEVHPLVCEIPVKTSGDSVAAIISLDGADVDNDICIFLQHSFTKLRRRRPDFPQPTRDQLVQLATRAGRRFIVASTMMKFIDDGHNDPRGRLQIMLDLTSQLLPGTEVYKLYDSILSTCADPNRAFLHLSVVATLADPLPASQISKLLGPGQGQDVEATLVQLQSVMDIPTDSSLPVNIYHSSARDYVSNPSNCSLPDLQYIPPHSLLASSSLSLMINDIPASTALLDGLVELKKHSEAIPSKDPRDFMESLAFVVQPPESLQVLSSLLWLRGDHAPALRCWLETPDGGAWLGTQVKGDYGPDENGERWLRTEGGHRWLETENGKQWLHHTHSFLRTEGGKHWLQTEAGQSWLQTEDGEKWTEEDPPGDRSWKDTEDGQNWLRTRAGQSWLQSTVEYEEDWAFDGILNTQAGQDWLQTEAGKSWLQTTRAKEFWLLNTRDGGDWLQTQNGGDWLRTQSEGDWMLEKCEGEWRPIDRYKVDGTWLQTPGGRAWLRTPSMQGWLHTSCGRCWLQAQNELDFLLPEGGKASLEVEGGSEWLASRVGQHWLKTESGQEWLGSRVGQHWLKTESGQEWLSMKDEEDWLQIGAMEDWLWSCNDWVQTQGPEWLQMRVGQDWLQTRAGRIWLQTQAGKNWLQDQTFGQLRNSPDWLKTQDGQDWLQSMSGKMWLPFAGTDWLQTQAGQDLLQTQRGRDWLQTRSGRRWLRTQGGKEWLQRKSGRDWLQTHGKAWPSMGVWVTIIEFWSASEVVSQYPFTPELPCLPAFQVIQHLKSLPDFLLFPVFLASRHHNNAVSALTQGPFPDVEIIHAMSAFVNVANKGRERSESASDALKYACHNWATHLARAPRPWDTTLGHIFYSFWNHNLLYWLEMQWCSKGLRACLAVLYEGEKLAEEYLAHIL